MFFPLAVSLSPGSADHMLEFVLLFFSKLSFITHHIWDVVKQQVLLSDVCRQLKNSTVFCCCFFFHSVHVGKIVLGENQFHYKHQIQSSVKSGLLTLIEELISALMGREIHLGCLKGMYLLRRSGCTFPLWLMRLFVFSSPLRRFIKRVEARFILINHPMVPWCRRKHVLWVLGQTWLLLDVMGTWQPMGCGI